MHCCQCGNCWQSLHVGSICTVVSVCTVISVGTVFSVGTVGSHYTVGSVCTVVSGSTVSSVAASKATEHGFETSRRQSLHNIYLL